MAARLLSLLAGAAALAAAVVWGVIGSFSIGWAFSEPDNTVARAEPDFGPPHNWGDVAEAFAWLPLWAAGVGLLVAIAVAFTKWAAFSGWPSSRRLARIPLGAVLFAFIGAGLSQGVQQL